jgi:hypothetical protein
MESGSCICARLAVVVHRASYGWDRYLPKEATATSTGCEDSLLDTYVYFGASFVSILVGGQTSFSFFPTVWTQTKLIRTILLCTVPELNTGNYNRIGLLLDQVRRDWSKMVREDGSSLN